MHLITTETTKKINQKLIDNFKIDKNLKRKASHSPSPRSNKTFEFNKKREPSKEREKSRERSSEKNFSDHENKKIIQKEEKTAEKKKKKLKFI
jgi:hypothetical protein